MNRNQGNRVGAALRLTACCLMFFALAGNAMAQNDPQCVIKKDGHYLAHVFNGMSWELQDATAFNPATCLWYTGNTVDITGTHHNYYFHDGNNFRFLSAPLQASGTLSLSASLPAISLLRNTDQSYYFFDWDWDSYGGGVARGHQYVGVTQDNCNHSWGGNPGQCWEVYWVECNAGTWALSDHTSYDHTDNSAKFRDVEVAEHDSEITNETGGLGELTLAQGTMVYNASQNLTAPAVALPYEYDYMPAYTTYLFEGTSHYFYDNADHTEAPAAQHKTETATPAYLWTVSGDGAPYLTIGGNNSSSATLSYNNGYPSYNQTATITLTVTYANGATQSSSATVVLLTECHNPQQATAPVVNYDEVVVSWYPTSSQYTVVWTLASDESWAQASSATAGNVTSYTITGLEYNTPYKYKVTVDCDPNEPTTYPFTTGPEPGLLVFGSVFGGGRMADVGGKTEVVVINCDSLGAVYGGNDIAGTVHGNNGADGSHVTLGVDEDDVYATEYGAYTQRQIRIGSVYGGGNGFYAYDGTTFAAATNATDTIVVAPGDSVSYMTPMHAVGTSAWTNTGAVNDTLAVPRISRTAITVTNDFVKVDSVFGGAKNAFLTTNSGNGSDITVNGGTIYAVFGGNNIGGTQGYGKHHILVSQTKTRLVDSIANTATTGYGRDFGIRYLFGGGNKVYGSTTDVHIEGGQCDTIFGGGNEADVYAANVTVNCTLGEKSTENNYTFGSTYTNAIDPANYATGTIGENTLYAGYDWNGFGGIYNVRTLFGGNNRAPFDSQGHNSVPYISLTSGSVGTVYGGGNEGDMLAQATDNGGSPLVINGNNVKYGTHVVMDSPSILVDYLYGGCQKSNVDYSTWTEIKDGHVGTVYGGCNISGDVGSTLVNPGAPTVPATLQDQAVQGSTYVVATGGIVHKNLFGGSNGFYHCNNGIYYVEGINYGNGNYVGLRIPSHNETQVNISSNAVIKGNVYAGGNMSPVGFTESTIGNRPYPQFVGWATVRMDGGTVQGSVYGGGNMASILGSNEAVISGGTINGAVYGGNDRSGMAGQFSNRILPVDYQTASDGKTDLKDYNTFVIVKGEPQVNTVYGGGNGDYKYDGPDADMQYCLPPGSTTFEDKPIQSRTFVDINIDNGGHINTVYGGGNGVTVTGSIIVFLNVNDPDYTHDHVNTIFGGNNKDHVVETGNVPLVPDIILLHGQVGTVYGGCNRGAMTTGKDFTIDGNTYRNVGSMVRLRKEYTADGVTVTPDAVVSQAVYGGCRMNDVSHNSLVLVEGGAAVPAKLFGGCDISGAVGDTSRVVVTGGNVNGDVFGGGNGYYTYNEGTVSTIAATPVVVATDVTNNPPTSVVSCVDILGGTVGTDATHTANVFGGGYGQPTNTSGNVFVNFGKADAASALVSPVMYGDIYGGSALGTVNTNTDNLTTVNIMNGTLTGNVFGGGLGNATLLSNGYLDPEGTVIEAFVNGTVHVNIGNDAETAYSNYLTVNGKVFGGNNLAGTPKGNVFVDVYRTAHTTANTYPNEFPSPLTNDFFEVNTRYALDEVYGGGNLAHYAPTLDGASAQVHVHNCDNTIRYVYAGGNAANIPTGGVTIDGGLVKYVFGGGNGEGNGNPGANVNGDNTLALNGGVMGYVFGGSNTKGFVSGETTLQFAETPNCSVRSVNELYGGGNEATDANGITLNVPCGTQGVKYLYGGSKKANVGTEEAPADIVLNVSGGDGIEEVYGGNNISGTIFGNVTLNLHGGTINKAFGGNNAGGDIKGLIQVNVLEDSDCGLHVDYVYGGGNLAKYEPTYASSGERISPEVNIKNGTVNAAVYGGGLGASAKVFASPKVTIGDNSNTAYKAIVGSTLNGTNTQGAGNVFGGGDQADVIGNTLVVYNDENTNSQVNNIFGGGNEASIGGTVNSANVGGTITVNMNNGNVANTIYGGCNVSGVVSDVINVTVNGGTSGNVVGGGNKAAYTAPDGNADYPYVRIIDGTVTGKVVGGGNEAGITGNPRVSIEGGLIGTTGDGAGVYGGCNITGTVAGNTNVLLTGGTVGMEDGGQYTGHIHGGGYGQETNVTGNVTVNFGADDDTQALEFPKLFGDLYGGSALGNVNTNADNTTTVNLFNGTIHGAAYGGGLGQKRIGDDPTTAIAALVKGVVHVNVGKSIPAVSPETEPTLSGQATLIDCDIYGCNNQNGSPQDNVYVDIYKTAHITTNFADYVENDATHAIDEVFGGGNEADFTPAGKKTYIHVHQCENTVRRLFGGGNAAEVPGVDLTIDGGRLYWVFGGGNGERGPEYAANIGAGGININIGGGRIEMLANGSNEHGVVNGDITTTTFEGCGSGVVVDHFMGANQADIHGGITETIPCGTDFKFVNLYCGSNLAQIYGNINLTIEGGVFENVFGGSKGSFGNTNLPQALQTYPSCIHDDPATGELEGHVSLLIKGGTIGNLYGACDVNGNVDGKVTITVDEASGSTCPLFIGNIYGGGNHTDYTPVNIGSGNQFSPEIIILKGVIGGTSPVVDNKPLLPVINPGYALPAAQYEGNVFGGGNLGNVTGNPRIIIGESTNTNRVTIEGNVYGGGNEGNVTGSPQVIIVPTTTE